jgi:hypothetical protein
MIECRSSCLGLTRRNCSGAILKSTINGLRACSALASLRGVFSSRA